MDRQIGSQFYERIALSQNKAAMLEKAENSEPSDLVTPEEAIKDPFVLEFLDLIVVGWHGDDSSCDVFFATDIRTNLKKSNDES